MGLGTSAQAEQHPVPGVPVAATPAPRLCGFPTAAMGEATRHRVLTSPPSPAAGAREQRALVQTEPTPELG